MTSLRKHHISSALLCSMFSLVLVSCQEKPQSVVDLYVSQDTAWHKIEDVVSQKANNKEEYETMMAAQAGPHPDIKPALAANMKIVKQDPKSDSAFAALTFMIEQTSGAPDGAKWVSRALPYLQKYHLARPEMLDLGYKLYRAYENDIPEYEAFMQALASQHPDPNAQANMWYYLARTHYYFLNGPDLNAQEREQRKESALRYLGKIIGNKSFAKLDVYNPRDKAKGREPKKLSVKSESLIFAIKHLSIGSEIPNVEMKDLQGVDDQILNYRGKVVLIDFWATWCGPCIASIPALVDMKKSYGSDGFEILSLSVDLTVEDVLEYREDVDMPWAHWFIGRKGKLLQDWNISAFPTYMLIDRDGNIKLITNEITDGFQDVIKELL